MLLLLLPILPKSRDCHNFIASTKLLRCRCFCQAWQRKPTLFVFWQMSEIFSIIWFSRYVPLLLDTAGVLTPQAQLAWRSRGAPFSEWWPAAVDALRARPFIPVDELTSALKFSMLHWLSLPCPCNRPQFNVSGPGLTCGLAKSHPCPKLFAKVPLRPRVTTSQHRCRRRCVLFSLARRLSPPSRASLKRCVPSHSMRQVRSHTPNPAHRPTHQRLHPCTSGVMRRTFGLMVLKTLATTSSGPLSVVKGGRRARGRGRR